MKEAVLTRTETIFVFFSLVLACTIIQISLIKSHHESKIITPFCIDFARDSEGKDLDNNLSGNAGISEEYYVKQLRSFLDAKSPF